MAEVIAVKGLGPAKATQLKAALELGKRLLLTSPEERPQVRSPADAANLLMANMSFLEQEHLGTMSPGPPRTACWSPTSTFAR